MPTAIEMLQALTNKKNITLTESGDHAIKTIICALKKTKKQILIQDQGGWLTYKDYAKKEKLEIIELKTNYGIINTTDLQTKTNNNNFLLINSLAGYFAEQPMQEIAKICKQTNCLLVNDVSGSIGTENAKIGDIIIGSFGKDKPVNLHYGGFIATNTDEQFENCNFNQQKTAELKKQLEQLKNRQEMFTKINNKIKTELANYEILHKNLKGINVIVKFNNEKEKQEIIKYCENNNYEYTLCPKTIRVLDTAISIEVKRQTTGEIKQCTPKQQ